MRLQRALYSAGLFGTLCVAARAPVYIGGYSSQSEGPTTLSYEDARLVLAEQLDVSQEYGLEGASDTVIDLLNQQAELQRHLFEPAVFGNGFQRRLVVVEGVDAENFLHSKTPAFYIDSKFDLGSNLNMASTFLMQDRKRRGSTEVCGAGLATMEIKDSIQGGFSSSDPLGICELGHIQSSEWWRSLSLKDKLDLLAAPQSEIASKIYNAAVPEWQIEGMTGIFHVWTLSDIADKSGISSSEYKVAVKEIQPSLDDLLASSGSSVVVLMPYSRSSKAKRSNFLPINKPSPAHMYAQRQPSSRQDDGPTQFPKTTIPTCYSDQSACEARTANCSGHGQCNLKWTETDSEDEKGAECWGCRCSFSVVREDSNGGGRKTITWGGPACQKKDVSVPFWLFASFGVAMAAAVSYGIGMLYSIGNDPLPSVLGAGVASVGARGK